jgi:acetate---CoA ligase (ADP-forming)
MSLERLLTPRSVALVGASADPRKISGMMVDFLGRAGYAGRVYPVNPRYEAIRDWRCYPSVDAIPETPDVVVVAVPVAIAFESLEQAAARGVPFVVLMTGGFGEGTSGAEGDRRRERLDALCARSGMRVLGPNTVGMVNFRDRMPLTFADWYGRDTGQRGGVAILTHSGSVGGLIFSSLQANKVGVDYWIASGNEAILEVADFIDHLADDPALTTIACFIEGVVDGRKFMAAAQKARNAGKRIVVLKAGESEASLRSTAAHTIKRSTHPHVYRAAFGQLGVVQVRSLQELTYSVKLLSTVGGRIGGRVGILSASGGACSLIADHVVRAGLELPELTPDVQRELAKFIPEYGSTRNPVDPRDRRRRVRRAVPRHVDRRLARVRPAGHRPLSRGDPRIRRPVAQGGRRVVRRRHAARGGGCADAGRRARPRRSATLHAGPRCGASCASCRGPAARLAHAATKSRVADG